MTVQWILPGITGLARRLGRAIWQMSLCPAGILLRQRAGVITQIPCGIISWTRRLLWRRNDPARRWQDASAGGIQDAESAPGEGDRSGVRAGLLFDPADLVQVKYEMVRRSEIDGVPAAAAAAAFGFSRQSLYTAKSALAGQGLAGPSRPGPAPGAATS